ncbi:hypothetical protein NMY22_g8623 [Coprinellus aureogranulatus]|nr:hypothetical protein NMY22_g8623 [Coprinellus aureogranulatus]
MPLTAKSPDPAEYWFKCLNSDIPIRVPSYVLLGMEQLSDVFAGGRELREASGEGLSQKTPIFLPDHFADFNAMVGYIQLYVFTYSFSHRVHHGVPGPIALNTRSRVASGGGSGDIIRLFREPAPCYIPEWNRVLRMATKYEMHEVRAQVIDTLSKWPWNGIEQIQRAREHRVAQWLINGVENILGCQTHPDSTLSSWSCLGDRTAAKILWIKCSLLDPLSVQRNDKFKLPKPVEGSDVVFRYSEMRCQSRGPCKNKPFHPDGGKCRICKTAFSKTDTFTTNKWFMHRPDESYQIMWRAITCPNPRCKRGGFMEGCERCGSTLADNQHTQSGTPREPSGVQDYIHIAFYEELKELRSA